MTTHVATTTRLAPSAGAAPAPKKKGRPKPRGFAALIARGEIERVRAIAKAGAKASAPTRHRFTSDEAKAARARVGHAAVAA